MAPETVRGRLILAHAVVPGVLVLDDGRIASLDLREDDGAAVAGPLVAPGFIDVHVHGFGGHDATGGPDALTGMARALLRRGVTSFLPTAPSLAPAALADFAETVRGWMGRAPADGADPLGFNLEGPFLAPGRRGAHDPRALREPGDLADAALEALLDGLRIVTIAPELDGALPLIERLAARGVAVSLGHSDATAEQGWSGYRAGARSTTHLFNAMRGLDHHAPGLAAAALAEDAAFAELIADGRHVHPALWPVVLRAKPGGRLLLVSDAIAVAGTGDGPASIGGLAVTVAGGRATLAGTDTLAGSTAGLDEGVRNLARAGVPLHVAVAAATANPAALLGETDRGRLEPGCRAHLVELDDDLRVRRVTRGFGWLDVIGAAAAASGPRAG